MAKNLKRKRDQDATMEGDDVRITSTSFGLTYGCLGPRLGGSHVSQRT
jgi:hypothetical protein